MNSGARQVYRFDEFELESDGPGLYYRGELVETGGTKMLRVLGVFLRNPNHLVSHDDVLNEVWGEGNSDAMSDNVNQYVAQLRRVLSKFEPDRSYFTNKKGRGYIFNGDVRIGGVDTQPATVAPEPQHAAPSDPAIDDSHVADSRSGRRFFRPLYVAAAGALIIIAVLGYSLFPWRDHDAEIRRVVRESQMYESLVLYRQPASFKAGDLDKYWTADLGEHANYDGSRIREAVLKMVDEGRRYGDESRCDQFEFQTIEIDATNKMAVVTTLEKWFVAVYKKDGELFRNRTVGPYFVSYIVRNIDGRWLVEKSTTGRVGRPTPRLDKSEESSERGGDKEFFFPITGQDFEPATVFIQAVGPGCPEIKPCKISNTFLLENAQLSDMLLDGLPMTLASGQFKIVAHNGDSQPSNPVYLNVP